MGCDIHMVVEKRENGIWVPAFFDDHKILYDASARNYMLFAVLADVRNRWDIKPIAEKRGIPNDISREHHQNEYDDDVEDEVSLEPDEYLGDHSYSWLLLKELQDYPWKTDVLNSGVVSEIEFEEWDRTKETPPTYCQGVGGPNIFNVSIEKMREIIKSKKVLNQELEERYFTRIEWEESIYEHCQTFVDKFLPALATLGAPEDVRIVFGFDS